MSIKTLLTNIGDYIEAGLKDIGVSDGAAADVATKAAAGMAAFVSKWSSDEMKLLQVEAVNYLPQAKTSGYIAAGETLVADFLAKSITITLDDALDAIRFNDMID